MRNGLRWVRPVALVLAAGSVASHPTLGWSADDPSITTPKPATGPGLYLKVRLARPVRMSKLKPGDVVEGSLTRDVYDAGHKVFSSDSECQIDGRPSGDAQAHAE